MASRTWYVSCSPRSPEKIKPELEQLATLEGESGEKTLLYSTAATKYYR
jgi:hypothetical protein